MSEKIPVMITGVGGGGHGEQILKAFRMADTPYEIIGGDMNSYSKGLKEVDHSYLLPPAKDPHYLKTVLSICKKHKVKALFHGSEPELKIMSLHRKTIRQENIFLPINPSHVINLCMNKLATFKFLEKEGFLYPKTKLLNSVDDLSDLSHFPVILKPSIGSGGSAHTFIAQNQRELQTLAAYMLDLKICPEIIVQEYKGTPETEFTVGILHDMDGNFLNSIAVRRDLKSSLSCRMRIPNLTGYSEYGPYLSVSTGISQGEIGPFPEVTLPCEKVAKAIGACGTINLQCRVHNGDIYIFEVNPRFSGTTSLRAMVGYNEPDILIRKHVCGEDIKPRFSYKSGIIVRGLAETLFEKEDIDRIHL
jgi:carbamoyl-phosphate synthase large subunit